LFDELGNRFWLKLFGGIAVFGVLLFIFLAIFMRTVYALGIFGGFIVMFVIIGGAMWAWDRRNEKKRDEEGPAF
jgi:hypothetical protein